jgi:DNA polymerase elongation subunit (family B)
MDPDTKTFAKPESATGEVLTISVVYEDKIILMGVKDLSAEAQERIKNDTNKYFEKYKSNYKFKYLKYDDEFDMMYNFFYKLVPKMPLITGWNFLQYDWMYLVNRAKRLKKVVNGKEYYINPAVSSLTKKLNKIWGTEVEIPCHRMIFDYMQLYEVCDTTIKVKESSSLDYVASKLVGVEKVKYSGSLIKLYSDDFEQFMYYNAVDSVLVQKIHDSKNYISIIFAISSLAQIKITDVVSQMNNALASLAITEGVLRKRFRDQENIVLFKDETRNRYENGEGDIEGGWVKDPVVGMNMWSVCFDFSSLYPTSQRQFYISPENFVGIDRKVADYYKSNNEAKADFSSEYCETLSGQKIKINLDEHVVCVNGTVFKKVDSPTIKMLEDVFADRKKNKKIMLQKKEELKAVQDEMKALEKELSGLL